MFRVVFDMRQIEGWGERNLDKVIDYVCVD